MHRLSLFLTVFLSCVAFLVSPAGAEEIAFPGAEGYGRWATGGRGGKIYVVTSLADDGSEGTFRWAVSQPGKKIVTFKVDGTIYLNSALNINSGDLTILGQTAPGQGICIADYPVTISCENVIIRYLRFRLGNRQVANHEGDGLGLEECNNVIIDHCSVSWSIDECLSVSEGSNITIQWCIISQALSNAGHVKGAHGYGGNWGGRNVSYLHNLIAQCTSRTPRTAGDGQPSTPDFVDIRNCVFYNWGGEGCYGAENTDINIVNNYYKPGPSTDKRSVERRKRILAPGIRTASYVASYPAFAGDLNIWGHFYVDGNVNPDYSAVTADNWTQGVYNQVSGYSSSLWNATVKDTIRLREAREFAVARTYDAQEAYDRVLAYAGASAYRDAVDQMIVTQVQTRWGAQSSGSNGAEWGQIDKQSDNVANGQLSSSEVENGAWPVLGKVSGRSADSDGDGISDVNEDTWGLDPYDPSDGAKKHSSGYAYTEYSVNRSIKAYRSVNDSCQAGGELLGTTTPTLTTDIRPEWQHEVSGLTFKGYDSKAKRQLYADGLEMEATGGIATGRRHCLKLKNGTQYKIHLPAGVKATALRIYGYANYEGADIYVKECGGTTFGSTDYVISGAKDTWSDVTVPLAHPVESGSTLTVTLTGNTPTVKFFVLEEPTTGLRSVAAESMEDAASSACYNLQGQRVAQPLRGQLYIKAGKKFYIK